MRHFASIILLTLTLNCFGQLSFDQSKISKQAAQVVTKIEKVNELMGGAVYATGMRPIQFDNFEELQKKASKDELKELINHPNGVVRCYSFWALTYDSSINLVPIIVRHIKDEAIVSTQFGCIASNEKVGDFFINLVTSNYVDLNSKKLDSSQLATIDSILIYTPNNLYAKQYAINRTKLTEKFYQRLRELVINDKNQSALVALSKYQREQDISLILNNKIGDKPDDGYYFTYQAISEFPHPVFFSLLEQNLKSTLADDHYSSEWSELYKAIASYKSTKAIELLNVPFTQVKHKSIRPYHIEFVFGAVQKFKYSVYDELMWKMWAEEKMISVQVFKYLSAKNPQRAFELTTQTLQTPEDFNLANYTDEYDSIDDTESLINTMFELVLTKDRAFAISAVNRNLLNEDISLFQFFADKASELKDTSFVGQLFIRLERDDNPHIYLKATEALIAYKSKRINKRIIETQKINRNLNKDWGGKEFSRLLRQARIL